MKSVAILVGHCGPGTGASMGERDEWGLCMGYAEALRDLLDAGGVARGHIVSVNRFDWPLKQANQLANGLIFAKPWSNIDLRAAACAGGIRVDAAIELHLNRYSLNYPGRPKAVGFEVFIKRYPGPRTQRLGKSLHRALRDTLGSRDRGLKQKSFRILRKLHAQNVPAALIEPAFLVENRVVLKEWRGALVGALSEGLHAFFGGL